MKILENTRITKKFIIVLVIITVFSFCCSRQVKAVDFSGNISDFIFWLERGVVKSLNNMFCDENHKYYYDKDGGGEDTTVYLTPETIIKGKFALLNPDIFENIEKVSHDSTNPEKDKYYDATGNDGEGGVGDSVTHSLIKGKTALRNTISGWYYALRNLAIVALLSILLYVAIRMMLTSIASDKAKYKTMLKDWAVSLCLVMMMHLIIIATLDLSSQIIEAIGTSGQNTNLTEKTMLIIENINQSENEDHQIQLNENGQIDSGGELYTIGDAFAQELLLFAIIGYTLIFAIKYLIRAITIIFLILLAPITCITYAIDKIGDGKAQAFNLWFQEFFYNVIIQPFHLLIYVVLIGAASDLANANPLYGIMCFAVMIPAEKLIKQMFGFKDKLGSPLGAMTAGAIGSQLLSKIKGSGVSEGKKDKELGSKDDERLPTNTKDIDVTGGNGGGGTEDNSEENRENINTSNGNGDGTEDSEETRTLENGGENNGENEESEENSSEKLDEESKNGEQNLNSQGASANNRNVKKGGNDKNKLSRASKIKRNLSNRSARYRLKKYGTTSRKTYAQRAAKNLGRKAYEGAKRQGRKTIKGATTLVGTAAGAVALGLVGAMFGRGKEAAAAGAALGGKLGGNVGNTITNATDGAWSAVEGLASDVYYSKEGREESKEKRDFSQDKNNIQLARQNFKDRNGVEATGKELQDELDKMYEMKTHGIKKENYNSVMEEYEAKKANGMNDSEAFSTAELEAYTAQDYNLKDFRDEKVMNQEYIDLFNKYRDEAGFPPEMADEMADKKAREVLNGAAKMKGARKGANLSGIDKTIKIPLQRKLPFSSLGMKDEEITEERHKRISNLTIQLEDKGFSPEDIKEIAEMANQQSNGNDADSIIQSYEDIINESVKYIESGKDDQEITKIVKGRNQGGTPTIKQKQEEKKERIMFSIKTGITDPKEISAGRNEFYRKKDNYELHEKE